MKRATLIDIDQSRFRKQPKALDENDYYKELSIQARYLYGVMLDKFKLSKKNNWVNKDGEVYFIFKQNDLAELMNVSRRSIKRYTNELLDYNLLEKESTMTVNLYYITLEYQQCENMSPRKRNNVPTNTQICPNNSETNYSETENNETENLLVSDETCDYVFFKDLYKDDLVKMVNTIIDSGRSKITEENYKLCKDKIKESYVEFGEDFNNFMIRYKQEKIKGRSVENFIRHLERYERGM